MASNFKIDALGRPIGRPDTEIRFDICSLGHKVVDEACLECEKNKSMTVQSHAIGITPGEIAKTYGIDVMKQFAPVPEQFMDMSDLPDTFTVLNWRKNLDDYFMSLPATLRAKFENDPMGLVKFVGDPANVKEAVSLGLMEKTELGLEADRISGEVNKAHQASEEKKFVEKVRKAVPPADK